MSGSNQLYTLGVWTVRPGKEEAFVREWALFAKWTAKKYPAAGRGYLLRDLTHPNQFISFGPWESMDAIKAWRELPEFKQFAAKAMDLCSEFQPHSMDVAATSEEGE